MLDSCLICLGPTDLTNDAHEKQNYIQDGATADGCMHVSLLGIESKCGFPNVTGSITTTTPFFFSQAELNLTCSNPENSPAVAIEQ